jgi:hexokinase
MYLGEITRNLLALVDAALKPVLFNDKMTECLNKHYRLNTEMLSPTESMQRASEKDSGSGLEEERAALRDLSEEQIVPMTLQHLNRAREIVQEHLGFAPGEVSLRDAALVQWAAASVVLHDSACAASPLLLCRWDTSLASGSHMAIKVKLPMQIIYTT